MEKFPSLRIQPSPRDTTQLTTRPSGPFAGEKTFLAKRDILYSQANKDSFVPKFKVGGGGIDLRQLQIHKCTAFAFGGYVYGYKAHNKRCIALTSFCR